MPQPASKTTHRQTTDRPEQEKIGVILAAGHETLSIVRNSTRTNLKPSKVATEIAIASKSALAIAVATTANQPESGRRALAQTCATIPSTTKPRDVTEFQLI